VLFFPQISVKKPYGKGKWGSNWGDWGVCFWGFQIRGTITELIKPPFLPRFHILQQYIHIMGDLPSNRFCEGLF
jgi:hypothetical protein